MTQAGLVPIELERYSRSNKIWSTKVKRLRLPDLLCVKTGLRIEVRAKSKLAIKMSDTPTNPERRWNFGLAAGDVIAFVLIREEQDGRLSAAENAELFWVEDLLRTESKSRLGPPKSGSEGAERDREWPSTVPSCSGIVVMAGGDRLTVFLNNGRTQSYHLQGKAVYRGPTEAFLAGSEFLAGIPTKQARFPSPSSRQWNPRPLLESASAVDRYVAVKALGRVGRSKDCAILNEIASSDAEGRVSLEAAASLTRLGDRRGLELLSAAIKAPRVAFLRMEAVLSLAEFEGTPLAGECGEVLAACAGETALRGDEVRQAAIWALGKDGLRQYERLINFLGAESDEELTHAVAGFWSDAGVSCVEALLAIIENPSTPLRQAASASYVLSRCFAPDPSAVNPLVSDHHIKLELELLQLTSSEINWTRSEAVAPMLAFVNAQTIPQTT
jgi:hypothetical protein